MKYLPESQMSNDYLYTVCIVRDDEEELELIAEQLGTFIDKDAAMDFADVVAHRFPDGFVEVDERLLGGSAHVLQLPPLTQAREVVFRVGPTKLDDHQPLDQLATFGQGVDLERASRGC